MYQLFRSRTDPTANGNGKASANRAAHGGRGVLLVNLGTPDEPTVPAVRRYLTEFLSDPAVIQLPPGARWLTGPLGRLMATCRAPSSTRLYQTIWSDRGSPLRTIADDQVDSLAQAMPRGWRVFGAMRYGRPSIPEVLEQIEAEGIEELVVVPMYPQFSGTTTGTALREVYDYLKGDAHALHITTRTSWFDDHGYISAQTELLEQYARSCGLAPDNAYLLFSTHGLPVSYVKKGDPYPEQVARTVALVGQRLGWPADRMSLAYQSRLGPCRWLEPYVEDALRDLGEAGERCILVCPISFTTDCLETLEELDVRHRRIAEQAGAELYLCPALNTFGPFISALKHLVLRGPRPMQCAVREVRECRPETPAADDHLDLDSLVLIGVSARGLLSDERGPAMTYADEAGLRAVKRSACEIPDLLRAIHDQTVVREAILWNTCHRFELYAWLDGPERHFPNIVEEVQAMLFDGRNVPPRHVNVLYGADAWHHLLRTATGINSSLPGERDVLDQLHGAYRMAERAGTAATAARRLVEAATRADKEIRHATGWGRFEPDYCQIALSRVAEMLDLDYAPCRIAVVGGSTTSAAVLRALTDHFQVPSRQLTLLYRGHKHGGQIKLLRKAIGQGRRVRVQSYAERSVTRAIADADVLIFGVDREEPVISADQLRDLRDWSRRPLTIVDFNTFGSTVGLDERSDIVLIPLRRLDAEVTAYAESARRSDSFGHAVAEAEYWISCHVSAYRRGQSGHAEDTDHPDVDSAHRSDETDALQREGSLLTPSGWRSEQ